MQFHYQARTSDGKARSGAIDAPNSEIALQALQRQNLIVTSLRLADVARPWYSFSLPFAHRVKSRDVMLLARQLATLFEAKIPVVRTFETLIEESENVELKKHLVGVLDDVKGGMSMSQAMARHPEVFSPFFIYMIRAGEEAGKLDEVFGYLAEYLERNYSLLTKTRNALIYPAFVMVAFVVIILFLFTTIIPKISAVIIEAGQELPFYTRIVLAASNFLVSYGIFLLFLAIAGGVLFVRYLRTPAGVLFKARMEISLPVIGNLFKKTYIARLADNLATLVTGGIPIVRSLQVTSDVIGNEIYRNIVLEAIEAVRGGSTIADAFGKHPEVPNLLSQMIRVGEETGKLDQLLKAVSRFYTQEVESLVENLVSLIEPVLIVVLGLGVALVVVSVIQPIYNLTSAF